MSGYELHYFNVRAKGEVGRLALSAANFEFKDLRHTREQWLEIKASGKPPLGQMPFIVTPEGKTLAQSDAILKYICKKGGLSPTDPWDEAVADQICGGVDDLRLAVVKAHFEKDEAKKEELRKEFLETTLPARLANYDALLKGIYFMGDKLTYADITFFDFFNGFMNNGAPTVPDCLSKFPRLVAHYEKVLENAGIKAWVERRPKTDF
nr:glutathione S-transferase-like [Pocillopora verrucosa]